VRLTTEEIAKAFLITPRTLAQRIVRAKAKIRETPIPYEVPTPQELPERQGAVLQVIYLVFNDGYSAAARAEVTRAELTGEAIRLGRLLTELRPEPEVIGLLSLKLLQESRHAARTSPTAELILLENQDRSLWNREQIAEGVALAEKALKSRRCGSLSQCLATSCRRSLITGDKDTRHQKTVTGDSHDTVFGCYLPSR
jgi:RNA polymerase sigma-70 factor (ECF subfamily)